MYTSMCIGRWRRERVIKTKFWSRRLAESSGMAYLAAERPTSHTHSRRRVDVNVAGSTSTSQGRCQRRGVDVNVAGSTSTSQGRRQRRRVDVNVSHGQLYAITVASPGAGIPTPPHHRCSGRSPHPDDDGAAWTKNNQRTNERTNERTNAVVGEARSLSTYVHHVPISPDRHRARHLE